LQKHHNQLLEENLGKERAKFGMVWLGWCGVKRTVF
jgi:hypothetical protein